MQTQCAISTMESEYLVLSQSMHNLIPLREIMKELMGAFVWKSSANASMCSKL